MLLHLNLLWLSSPEADLQVPRTVRFNHPRLLPQVAPRIPSHTASTSERISVLLERRIRLFEWARHIRSVCFENTNLQVWTAEHPYANPFSRFSIRFPDQDDRQVPPVPSGEGRGAVAQSLSWVDREHSLQWAGFERLVEVLRSRNNRITVVVGPLNEHRLDPAGREEYRRLVAEAGEALTGMRLDWSVLSLLPVEQYADLSHPVAPGYALMAEEIFEVLGLSPGPALRPAATSW